MKFGNIIRVETSRYLTKITILRKADREGSCIWFRYNYHVQLVATKARLMRVPNLKFWSPRQRGGEAGRAQSCRPSLAACFPQKRELERKVPSNRTRAFRAQGLRAIPFIGLRVDYPPTLSPPRIRRRLGDVSPLSLRQPLPRCSLLLRRNHFVDSCQGPEVP